MITSWEVYWLMRLDAVNGVCITIIALGGIALILPCIHYFVEDYFDEDDEHAGKKRTKRLIRSIVGAMCISGFIALFVPTTKEAAVIYLLPKIANNEQVQKIPENFVKVLNGKMEEWIAGFEKKEKK